MPRSIVVLTLALLLAVPAVSAAKGPLPEPDDGPDPRGLTLSGAATARVTAAGMQPGALFSIAEVHEPFGEQQLLGTFGPGRFCGMVNRAIVRRDPATGRRRVVRRVRQRRCFFPSRSTVTMRVTLLPL